jgi:hypothetical protein
MSPPGNNVYVLESTYSTHKLNSPIVITSGMQASGTNRFPRNNGASLNQTESLNSSNQVGKQYLHQQIIKHMSP